MQDIANLANIHYIRQKEPLGLGHAVLCAKHFIDDEPFAVLLGDDIMVSETPAFRQLMVVYNAYGTEVVGVQSVPHRESAGNEIQLTDALREVCREQPIRARLLEGNRCDIGDKLGCFKWLI